MPIEVLLVQILVLAFTGVLWWIARRDLASRALPPVLPTEAADTAELEQLCTTLAALVTSLTRRLEAVERQTAARPSAPEPLHLTEPLHPADFGSVQAERVDAENASRTSLGIDIFSTENQSSVSQLFEPTVKQADPVPDLRFAPVYALLEAGVSDPVEIARQTGLGRGEVDLILNLRDRRAF